jgi:serine/threonine-protein kinase
MGVVYKGYEPSLARYVAIKELSAALSHDSAVVERFLREARSMALLNDPHIIQIYSIGQENGLPFFVMEFVDGSSVAALIQRDKRLQPGDAMKVVHHTAKGLSAAHERGVIHRDIKPANLMVSQRGQVKIADFGIALANADMNQKLTSVGEMVGTPGYLPPELLLGKQVDQRSDVYALGVVLFEMLTGRTPFSDASVYKLMLDVVQSEVPDVREINADIDPGVAAILAKMLIKEPGKRYQSMGDLIKDLDKHPLVAGGGPLKLGIRSNTAGESTALNMAIPQGTPSSARGATPPPVMDRRGPLSSGGAARAASTPSTGSRSASGPDTPPPPDMEARPEPGEMATTPGAQAAAMPAPPKRLPWSGMITFAIAVAVSAYVWLQRDAITAWIEVHAPHRGRLAGMWLMAEESGTRQLAPILRQLHIGLDPTFVFDLLAALVVLLLLRNIYASIIRARNRRAYERAQQRPPS